PGAVRAERVLRKLQHFEQRHQETDRAFRALVLIDVRQAHAVGAAAGASVVQRQPEAVPTQEPRERPPPPPQTVLSAGRAVGRAEGRPERGGIDGLLVRARLLAADAMPTGVADELQLIVLEADLLEKRQ